MSDEPVEPKKPVTPSTPAYPSLGSIRDYLTVQMEQDAIWHASTD